MTTDEINRALKEIARLMDKGSYFDAREKLGTLRVLLIHRPVMTVMVDGGPVRITMDDPIDPAALRPSGGEMPHITLEASGRCATCSSIYMPCPHTCKVCGAVCCCRSCADRHECRAEATA